WGVHSIGRCATGHQSAPEVRRSTRVRFFLGDSLTSCCIAFSNKASRIPNRQPQQLEPDSTKLDRDWPRFYSCQEQTRSAFLYALPSSRARAGCSKCSPQTNCESSRRSTHCGIRFAPSALISKVAPIWCLDPAQLLWTSSGRSEAIAQR